MKKSLFKKTSLSKMPLKYKEEVLLIWHCDGGFYEKKNLTKRDLGVLLDLSETKIDKMLDSIKSSFVKMFEGRKKAREQTYVLCGSILQQINRNRAKVLFQDEIIDEEISKIRSQIREYEALPEGTSTEMNYKHKKIRFYYQNLQVLFRRKNESHNQLHRSTEALCRYLELFIRARGSGDGIDMPHQEEDGSKHYLTKLDAIRILEESGNSTLPQQRLLSPGPRNPNLGFEEFEEPKE